MTRVLLTDIAWPSADVERRVLAEVGAELVLAPAGTDAELAELATGVAAVLVNWRPLPALVLEAARDCLTVARCGVGVDNIDVAKATELGMLVTNVPGFCRTEVADHTMALVLATLRNLVPLAADVRAGHWDNGAAGPMHRLGGRVLGLVGYGAIGQAVATRAVAFGLRVLAWSPSTAGHPADPAGVEFAPDLATVLAEADVLSLHLPLSAATRHLIGANELAAMKPGALLVNTSRGGLVDQPALVAALEEGRLAGAALDVLDPEPPSPDDPLLHLGNVLVTPHAAFASVEAVTELQESAARHVADVLAGRLPEHIVNREVLSSPSLRMSRDPGR